MLSTLSSAPADISEELLKSIERFIILVYDKTSKCVDINKARKMLADKNNVQLIPPLKAAMEQHVKRAVNHVGYVWSQMLLLAPELPSPDIWGWSRNQKGMLNPHWAAIPEASLPHLP